MVKFRQWLERKKLELPRNLDNFRKDGVYYKQLTPGIPKYNYDVNKITSTRLDPG